MNERIVVVAKFRLVGSCSFIDLNLVIAGALVVIKREGIDPFQDSKLRQ